ncbi:MAG TPA: phosphoribosylaminoimidazolesuccinocarboxamide synthase [Bacteroidota bacterium]|nr:phosphoribosylaminoimidazolesuccinocarboxamide synthase [Bacteroidota bacterium]
MTQSVITATTLAGLAPAKQGKVRDIYDLGENLLIVATDRLSAFDVILPDGIPNKGKVLTQISAFWFRKLAGVVGNHLISTDAAAFPEPFRSHPGVFAGRSMVVRKTRPLAVECIARGYLSGSGWTEYKRSGSICGVKLPPGLRESDRLPSPVFTPTTKAEIGTHDENITFEDVVALLGDDTARRLRDLTLSLYTLGAEFAATRGIIIADTKFEFGLDDAGALVWIDEALTPDSSRFWPMDLYAPGGAQPSFDKQYVRDYLLSIRWDKKPPAPRLPEDVIQTTAHKYEDALLRLAGTSVA